MFGHDKQDDSNEDNSVPVSVVTQVTDDDGAAAPAQQSDDTSTLPPAPQDELTLPAPSSDDINAEPTFIETPPAPVSMPEPTSTPEIPAPVPDAELSEDALDTSSTSSTSNTSDLSSLKQDALRALSPLIGHLDQTPEEKYTTAKMVYEETKDHSLLSAVYEAAKNLPDEKAKAAALYDVVQKINAV